MPSTPSDAPTHPLTDLVDRGDRACARRRADELAAIAGELAPCVAPPEQLELERVARLAPADLSSAEATWNQVVARLHRLGVLGGDAPLQLAAR